MTIRGYVLSMVLVAAIAPLAIVGAWLTSGGVRSGEALLGSQLDASIDNVAAAVARRWEYRSGELEMLARNEVTRRVAASGVVMPGDSAYLAQSLDAVNPAIASYSVRAPSGATVWSSDARLERRGSPLPRPAGRGQFEIVRSVAGRDSAGELVAMVSLDGILPADSALLGVPGSALAIRNVASGEEITALRPGTPFPSAGHQRLSDSTWLIRTRRVDGLPLELAVGAPSAAYTAPFAEVRQQGLIALLAVAGLTIMLVTFFTGRLSASLQALVARTDAIARGDLAQRANAAGPAEFSRLAGSFNAMAESLERSVTELTQRKSLAAVGEFATSLSHEVRNSLTAVQVDLERATEHLSDDTPGTLVRRALSQVQRLDTAVTGALRVARSGHADRKTTDLAAVLESAVVGARSTFTSAQAVLDLTVEEPRPVIDADPDALRHLFLNLLLNAGQSLAPGGRTSVSVRREDVGWIRVEVADTGRGIAPANLARATKPFFTTRPEGTGLGLPIARQIAEAHRGTLEIASTPGQGTTVTVRLPCR